MNISGPDYNDYIYPTNSKEYIQRENAVLRAEAIPEMTEHLNQQSYKKDKLEEDKEHRNENVTLADVMKQAHIESKEKEKNIEAAEATYNQGVVSSTLSLTGVTNDLINSINNFKSMKSSSSGKGY